MRRGVPPAYAAVRRHSRNAQSPHDSAILRQRRRPRQWRVDIVRRYWRGIGTLSSPAPGECLMAVQSTRSRLAGDWISPPSAQVREPALATGLPVPAEDGGAIAVFQPRDL